MSANSDAPPCPFFRKLTVSLEPVKVTDALREIPHTFSSEHLIDLGNDRIAEFMLSNDETIPNFVTCDFHLIDLAMTWLQKNHLITGNNFCEFGSGYGVVTLLAADRGMKSVGIEIEPTLVERSTALAEELSLDAEFYCGSFIPRDIGDLSDLAADIENVDTSQGDVYEEIGMSMDEFDLMFAFPWPGEGGFFEAVFDAGAASGALLMTYRGRDGVNVVRKT